MLNTGEERVLVTSPFSDCLNGPMLYMDRLEDTISRIVSIRYFIYCNLNTV